MWFRVGAVLAMMMVVVAPAVRAQGGDWIEALPGTWNAPGAAIPQAPSGDAGTLARCADQIRPASTAADRALEAAGWKLFGPVLAHGSTSIVRAMSNVDGMCRPLAYHAFVFVDDDFVGTLSPAPMNSRTDGSLAELSWVDAGRAAAVFARYAPEDPLCCPTRESTVEYAIEQRDGRVVLVAQSATTAALAPPPAPPEPPPPLWTGSLGAGVSVTSGNTDTSSYNLAFSAVRDPKKKYVFRTEGLYLRSDQDGIDTADKTTFLARGERSLSERLFAFAEAGYLRDRFKDIDYLVSPLVGIGWKALLPEPVSLVFDAGVGGAFEKNPGGDSTSDAAFKLGESLDWALSKRATLTQSVMGLWKMDDTEDAFYHAEIAIAASLTARSEIRVAYLIDYDNLPTSPELDKTDTALLATVVMKF
jgi:putative salt-induced outer membrane protein YdiY